MTAAFTRRRDASSARKPQEEKGTIFYQPKSNEAFDAVRYPGTRACGGKPQGVENMKYMCHTFPSCPHSFFLKFCPPLFL